MCGYGDGDRAVNGVQQRGRDAMRWVHDQTGRFRWRPYYEFDDIDAFCEDRIERFLRGRHGVVQYPVSTDDLTRLIEQEASDLDLYADLSGLDVGRHIEGVTTFYSNRRPTVRIAHTLSLDPHREPRLRTTLAHELGHVLLHDFAHQDACGGVSPMDEWDDEWPAIGSRPIIAPDKVDWMEWQAGYASGALLMPRRALRALVEDEPGEGRIPLIDRVMGHFLVSKAAAQVRLRQLGDLAAGDPARDLRWW